MATPIGAVGSSPPRRRLLLAPLVAIGCLAVRCEAAFLQRGHAAAVSTGSRVRSLRVPLTLVAPEPRRTRAGGRGVALRDLRRSFVQVGLTESSSTETKAAAEPPAPLVVFGSVYVGTPPQEFSVAFDTGSGNVLLPAKSCKDLSCLSHKTYDEEGSTTAKGDGDGIIRLSVGAGHLEGRVVQDNVCLAPEETLCAPTTLVAATSMSSDPFSLLPYDGVLGLGLLASSVAQSFNFVGNLIGDGDLPSSRFGIFVAREGGEGSEVTFGDLSQARLGSELLWKSLSLDAIKNSAGASGLWQLPLSDMVVNGARLGMCQNSGGGDCMQAALDTGTGVIAGPTKFIEAIKTVLDVREDCTNYHSLPTFGFAFGDDVLSLEPADYTRNKDGRCYAQLLPIDLPPPRQSLVLLGVPFLQRYYTVYDRQALRVGFALARHAGENSSEVAARLMVYPEASDAA